MTGGAGGTAGGGTTGGSGGRVTTDAAADATVVDATKPADATTPNDTSTATDAPTVPDGTNPGTTDAGNGADGADNPMGFAAIPGMGLNTTTGGRGGTRVTVTTFAELSSYLDSDDTLIMLVQGAIDLGGSMVPMRSNKTLVGLAGARLVNGGIEMNRRQNIIIRNLTFADGTDDTLKINQNTHHVWVDHCDFSNAPDGLFDITRQSSYITISWNHFHNHSKTMLIGHGDDATDDTGYLKTTIHHNWFDGTEQRHPRVRFGEVHVFNNYFLSNALYGVASTMEADVVVEGNYFEGVAYPTYVGYDASGPGDLVERNNVYDNSGTPQTRGTAFDPSAAYPYVVDDPAPLRPVIRTKTGVGVIDPMKAAQ
jgi:pectate lyase